MQWFLSFIGTRYPYFLLLFPGKFVGVSPVTNVGLVHALYAIHLVTILKKKFFCHCW